MITSPDIEVIEQTRLGLGMAFLRESRSLGHQRTLTLPLAQRVNGYGRTIDEKLPAIAVYLPLRSHYGVLEDRETLLGRVAWQLPQPITTSWNRIVYAAGSSIGEMTVKQLRESEINVMGLSRASVDIVKAALATPDSLDFEHHLLRQGLDKRLVNVLLRSNVTPEVLENASDEELLGYRQLGPDMLGRIRQFYPAPTISR